MASNSIFCPVNYIITVACCILFVVSLQISTSDDQDVDVTCAVSDSQALANTNGTSRRIFLLIRLTGGLIWQSL